MKILIINASPRKNGNTFIITQLLAEKLKSIGEVEVENLFLSDWDLELCKGCCNCLIKGENFCPNKCDDRVMLEEKILSADGVIFASPVYAMNMTALMKNFMDRFAFTMHRPRFFDQYTMIVSVTGAIGLKETIDSIAQLHFSGFNIVKKLGIRVENPLVNPSIDNIKLIKKIETEAEEFYKIIKAKKPIKPSFMSLMAFKSQKKCFFSLKDKAPCDWEYFDKNGWFASKCNYYTDKANISFAKDFLSNLICNFL